MRGDVQKAFDNYDDWVKVQYKNYRYYEKRLLLKSVPVYKYSFKFWDTR